MVSGIGAGTTKIMDLHDEAGLAEDQMDVVVGGLSVPGGMTKKLQNGFDLGPADHIDKPPTDPKSILGQAEAEFDALKGKGHGLDPKQTFQQLEQAAVDALKGHGHGLDPKLLVQQQEARLEGLKGHGIDPKLILQQVEQAESDALKGNSHGLDPKLLLQQAEQSRIDALEGKDHGTDPKSTLKHGEPAEVDAVKGKDLEADAKLAMQQALTNMISEDINFIKDLQDAKADQMSKISKG